MLHQGEVCVVTCGLYGDLNNFGLKVELEGFGLSLWVRGISKLGKDPVGLERGAFSSKQELGNIDISGISFTAHSNSRQNNPQQSFIHLLYSITQVMSSYTPTYPNPTHKQPSNSDSRQTPHKHLQRGQKENHSSAFGLREHREI